MSEITYLEILMRLVLAVVLGGIVGFERERHNRPAGFRTHILVCVGSALIMMVSSHGFYREFIAVGSGLDPSRVAAQVVTGVGFLGAGTILRHGSTITGLTTAASLWVVSGIGLAIGIGFYGGAVMTTMAVLVSLLLLGGLENAFSRMKRYRHLWIRGFDRPGLLGKISGVLGEMDVNIVKVVLSKAEYDESFEKEVITIEFQLCMPSKANIGNLLRKVGTLPGIIEAGWEGGEVSGEDFGKDYGKKNNKSEVAGDRFQQIGMGEPEKI